MQQQLLSAFHGARQFTTTQLQVYYYIAIIYSRSDDRTDSANLRFITGTLHLHGKRLEMSQNPVIVNGFPKSRCLTRFLGNCAPLLK